MHQQLHVESMNTEAVVVMVIQDVAVMDMQAAEVTQDVEATEATESAVVAVVADVAVEDVADFIYDQYIDISFKVFYLDLLFA